MTAGRGNRTNIGCVKCGCRIINCPFSSVASLVRVAGESTA